MVGNVTSLTNNGLRDWLLQRFSALILAAFSLFLITYICLHPQLDFLAWRSLFQSVWMRSFTVLTLLSLLVHAWIGLWTVSTDYIKCTRLRLVVLMLLLIVLVSYLVWGIEIVWGVVA